MRPKTSSHRNHRIVFQVYPLEKKAIELSAKKSGLSLSDYARKCCLGREVQSRMNEEELQLYLLLIEYRNNFSRISNLMKERKGFEKELRQVISNIDEQLKKFIE